MSNLSSFKSSVVSGWSKTVWDGLIDAIQVRLAPLEEQLGVQREVVDSIIARGLLVIELELAPIVTQADDKLTAIEQMRVDAVAAYAVIQALADEDIGAVIQPLLVESQQMLDDANEALAEANATIANIQTTDEKDAANGYAGLDAAGKVPFAKLSDVPPASDSTAGVAKLATGAEVQGGTVADKIITPATLTSRTATTDRAGMAELATEAEAKAGVDTDRTIVPFTLSKVLTAQAVRFDAAQTLTAAQQERARANIAVQKKNYVINGAMQISQQNASAAGTATGYYPVDQFRLEFTNAGTQTIQQVASVTPAGSPNRIRVTATVADATVAAGDYCMVYQRFEGRRVADLRLGSGSAKTITVQFGVKAPAGTFCVSLRNAALNRCYVAEYVIAPGEANTDVVKSVTIALDQSGTWAVDSTVGLEVDWTLMCGTTFQTTAGAWAAGNFIGSASQYNFMGTVSNVFELFDVSLTEGTVAPPFVVPDYAETLRACQRYWENGGFYASAPDGQYANICYKVTKRTAATVTTTLSGTVVVNSTEDHGFHVITSAGTSGFSFTADARL